jgi:TRAP-type mannitol/chloroaromatic compound transport system permease small subunit
MNEIVDASARQGRAGPGGHESRSGLERFADRIEQVIDRIGRLAAWLGLALVLFVAYDVLGRYVLGGASVAMQELEWHLLPPIALIGMSYTMCHREHVRVDVFYEKFPPRIRIAIDLFAALLTAVIALLIIKLSLNYVWQSYRINEGSPDPGGLPYRFILKGFIPAGFALLFVQAVAQCIKTGLMLVRSKSDGA